jgi:hypothetical protein
MPRNFSLSKLTDRLPKPAFTRDAKSLARTILGSLVALNLIAAFFVVRPLGGSPQDLEEQLRALRSQIQQRRTSLGALRTVSSKVDKGRTEGNTFMQSYFLNDRVASMNLIAELNTAAKESKIKVKEHTFTSEPIEGSADLNMMTINGNYEGSFADLMEFVNRLDRSKQLIIIESLTAQPQVGSGLLSVNLKLNTFVREGKAE